jgi:hypothetical protein
MNRKMVKARIRNNEAQFNFYMNSHLSRKGTFFAQSPSARAAIGLG